MKSLKVEKKKKKKSVGTAICSLTSATCIF